MPKYHQGKYRVKNKEKYMGDHNNVVYRSSYELKMFVFCDTSSKVKRWVSEEVVIPYVSPFDGRWHRYFTDIYAEMEDGRKILAEIKPEAEKYPPKKPKRRSRWYEQKLRTYVINMTKWKAAKEWADKNDAEFQIITEKELGIKYK